MITEDTRIESLNKLNKERIRKKIIDTLKGSEDGMTAREIAQVLFNKGEILSNDRQATAPRLTELMQNKIVIPVGKKKDVFTGRTVAIYKINN